MLISKLKVTFLTSPKNIITIYVVFLLIISCMASGLMIKVDFLTWMFSSHNKYSVLQGDAEILKKYCSGEVIERCKAEHQAYQSQGIFFDNKVRIYILNTALLLLKFIASFCLGLDGGASIFYIHKMDLSLVLLSNYYLPSSQHRLSLESRFVLLHHHDEKDFASRYKQLFYNMNLQYSK